MPEEYELRAHSTLVHGGEHLPLPVTENVREEHEALALGSLSPRDRTSFYFLTLLYFAQGVPCGLAFGSIPFLLKEKLSYSQIGIFSFATFPYSLKLLWSPIVDGYYFKDIGRRKSWIVPAQLFNCLILFYLGAKVDKLMANAGLNLTEITFLFGVLVMGCATQDIAVDGWALTILSDEALPYASTAQTIGINTGYFTSFTVFLALSSPEFANKYFRSVPDMTRGLITLQEYLYFCGILFLGATACVIYGNRPDPRQSYEDSSVRRIYQQMIGVIKLPSMIQLICVHLVAKIAFQAADTVTNLKLLERGLSKEDLALIVLIDFPFEIIFGYYAAKWSTGPKPLKPWMWAYVLRLGCACILMMQVWCFPKSGQVNTPYLLIIIVMHVLSSFFSTVQAVSITAFHTKIADPSIGGTYMTILNTLCNIGGQWPRAIVFAGVDWFTKKTCNEHGVCRTVRDGYYTMNIICVLLGLVLYVWFIHPTALKLQSLPVSAWGRSRQKLMD